MALQKGDANTSAAALASASVDGISMRETWSKLEPSDGTFDWSFLDAQVASAKAAGKAIELRVADSYDGRPAWVMSGVTQVYKYLDTNTYHSSYNQILTIPCPWDTFYLAKKKAMIAAVGARYNSNANVKIVSFGIANAHSDDWAMPHDTATELADWVTAGYTTAKLVGSCNEIIDAAMNAFPSKLAYFSFNPNGKLDATALAAATTVISSERAKWGSRLVIGNNALSAKTPLPPGTGSPYGVFYTAGQPIAFQMLWFSFGDATCRNIGKVAPCDAAATLRQSVDNGKAYGAKWIELYNADVANLPDVVAYAHTQLTQ